MSTRLLALLLSLFVIVIAVSASAPIPATQQEVADIFGRQPIEMGEFENPGSQRLIRKREGICFLQAVSGGMEGYGQGVAVVHGDGQDSDWWIVRITKTNPWQLKATVYCYSLR